MGKRENIMLATIVLMVIFLAYYQREKISSGITFPTFAASPDAAGNPENQY